MTLVFQTHKNEQRWTFIKEQVEFIINVQG